MNNEKQRAIDSIIVNGFTNTLLPIFSWLISQLFSDFLENQTIIVLLNPTFAYRERIRNAWVDDNDIFSCAEILSFQTASGRRHGRLKLRNIFAPFLREIKKNPEWFLFKNCFRKKLTELTAKSDGSSFEIPLKARIEIDIAEMEKTANKQLGVYGTDDVLESFPKAMTLTESELKARVREEFEDGAYRDTVMSLLWEASFNWDTLRKVRIRENSLIWKFLDFNPHEEPVLGKLIKSCLDFVFNQPDESKFLNLVRWFMDRMIVSEFMSHPYSDRRHYSFERDTGKGLKLINDVYKKSFDESVSRIEEAEILAQELAKLPLKQREAAELFLKTNDLKSLKQKLGETEYKAQERNFERALKRLKQLRNSDKIP